MYQLTKTQLQEWFNTPTEILPYQAIANILTEKFDRPVLESDVKEIYRRQGYDLATRPRKATFADLVNVIDDVQETTPELMATQEEDFSVNGIYN